jgi:hypothetical protein
VDAVKLTVTVTCCAYSTLSFIHVSHANKTLGPKSPLGHLHRPICDPTVQGAPAVVLKGSRNRAATFFSGPCSSSFPTARTQCSPQLQSLPNPRNSYAANEPPLSDSSVLRSQQNRLLCLPHPRSRHNLCLKSPPFVLLLAVPGFWCA